MVSRQTMPVTLRILAPLLLAIAVASPVHAAPEGPGPTLAAGDVDPPIALRGLVVDRAGRPVEGATIELVDFAAASHQATPRAASDADGGFAFTALPRRSVLLRVGTPAHYTEVVPVDLQRPARMTAVGTGAITLTERAEGRARLVFVGDTMFGRRFVDRDQDGEEGEDGELIRPTARITDSRRLLRFVRDALSAADYTLANLECVVTNRPNTPHPYKPFVFHSHPDTLAGLVSAGVDGVSSGNNHLFDYLGPGVADTLDFVAAAGLDDTGAGLNESLARDTTIWHDPNGVEVALQGMSEMRNDGSEDDKYELIADDPAKPGALYASRTNLEDFLTAAGGAFAVPVLHGGNEYEQFPNARMRGLFVAAVEGGAGLVVAHHPHVPHGIAVIDGPDAPRFVILSLGNFLFDQDLPRTIESMIAVVDVEARAGGGHDVVRVEMIPVRADGYVPKLLAGEGLARLGRHLGHLSTYLAARPADDEGPDGLRGAVVFTAGHRVVALADPHRYEVSETRETVDLPVSHGATAALTFTRHGPADSLARVHTAESATIELGRDVLTYGDFEDFDVDGERRGGFGWSLSASAFVQSRTVRHGVQAAALRRTAGQDTDSLVTLRRVPVDGDTRLTIRGHLKGAGAGTVVVRAQFFDATSLLAEEQVHSQPGGSYDWTRFAVTLNPPAEAIGMRLSFRQSAPKRGTGVAFLDDVAVIQWERRVQPGEAIATPNAWDFFRFVDIADDVDAIAAHLIHRRYALR